MGAGLIRMANIVRRNRFLMLGLISLAACIAGSIWSRTDPTNNYAFYLWFFGWISFLLVVGYFSTPSNSVFGKVAFRFVVLMVIGIVMKILHLLGGEVTIIVALVGIFATYVIMWFGKRK
jgi:hypothetical protein